MAQQVSVTAAEEGWLVRYEHSLEAYPSGASAERAARHLASQIASMGRSVEVAIFLKDGTLGGRFLHPAAQGDLRLAS